MLVVELIKNRIRKIKIEHDIGIIVQRSDGYVAMIDKKGQEPITVNPKTGGRVYP